MLVVHKMLITSLWLLKVDDSCVQTQECYQCGIDVPLRNLREHLNTCSCGADPVDKVEVCECLAWEM